MTKVLVAMSGGVDSSVAAALLKNKGFEVCGCYMKNWLNENKIIGNCSWQNDIKDAKAVAKKINIDFQVVNFVQEYRKRIVDYLLKGYQDGITPNPDVFCNREIKFGIFLKYARENGFDGIATGHYARTQLNTDGSTDLLCAADKIKNQTYFLALLRQRQICQKKIPLFPIGKFTKRQVRSLAEKFALPTMAKKDSQGICFIGQVKMSDFLKKYLPKKPGEIIDSDGNILGEHPGLHFFTLGQRRGIGIPSNKFKKHYVVIAKILQKNKLVVALEEENTPLLYAKKCRVNSISYINKNFKNKVKLQVQVRYRAIPVDADFYFDDIKKQAIIDFDQPQRAISPGQICAFYDMEKLLGGGIFAKNYYERPLHNKNFSM